MVDCNKCGTKVFIPSDLEPLESTPELRFPTEVVGRVHTIMRLHLDLEVGYPAMGLVLGLLERIERLEAGGPSV